MPHTFTLVIETSTPHASIALVGPDGALVEQREFSSDRNHNALLFSPLQEIFQSIPSLSIGLVLIGSGPGSYSGTRVGIAAAQGIAIASGCPVVAVPSILAAPSSVHEKGCIAIGDARRGSFWFAKIQNHSLKNEPLLCNAEELSHTLSQALQEGSPIISFEDPSRFPFLENITSQIKQEFPTATRLWHAWSETTPENHEQWAAEIPQPIYLKPPHITPGKRSPFIFKTE